MRRTLGIWEQSLGPDHPNVAHTLNNLARLLQAANRLSEAEPLLSRALGIDEQTLGAEHPRVARDINNLALLLKDTNRLAEAEPLKVQPIRGAPPSAPVCGGQQLRRDPRGHGPQPGGHHRRAAEAGSGTLPGSLISPRRPHPTDGQPPARQPRSSLSRNRFGRPHPPQGTTNISLRDAFA